MHRQNQGCKAGRRPVIDSNNFVKPFSNIKNGNNKIKFFKRESTFCKQVRPWLLFGAPITGLVLVLCFWAHLEMDYTGKIIYMSITYGLLVLGYTCVNLPYGTLCGAMTQNIDERAQINTSRSVAAMIAIGIINIITVPLVKYCGDGTLSSAQGFIGVAAIYGLVFHLLPLVLFCQDKGGGGDSHVPEGLSHW